ncbi:hypothetical protein COL154_012033 [Colletotrichum chrysophilum]|uniref:uncharacterized protein n=1 Tax=Colletotrichum chrysophilum TaxID=1836956 RepID=UPI00230008E1|nr:uncharacterized protein COL26b_004868 [Colletotrichum chrysophilum]KAJ0345463.1 hypothetical protein KNSL1_008349 [Colletotrichum chrysophilum]KAJ0353699.1 hypothetical protein COL154_012033 [Colletotrichum chrysophilum]KAJ0376816.1 hypothetical protein COL26b_004868 [Colletotrichum chrysophilum]
MASRESFGRIGSDDDWEEIADNYSVKSLSSDDEEDEKPAASPVPTRSKVESSPRSQTSPTRHAPQVNANHDANDANMSNLGDALSAVDIGSQSAPRPTSPVSVDKMAAMKTASASKPKAPLPPSQQDSNGSKTSDVSNESTYPILPYNDATQELGSWKQSTMGKVTSTPLKNLNPQESGPRRGAKGAPRIGAMSLEGFTEQERKPKEVVSQYGASFGASTHDTVPVSLGDTLDLDETSTDPIVIDNALQSLSRMLRDTSPALCIMHLKHATKVLPACKSLLAQVDSLTPILAAYAAKCNQPTTTARDVPLDASLMMWIVSLSRTLWEIGFEFKIVESNNPGSSSPKRAPSLETLVGELESAAKQMDEFLPIIQADFAEFQKKPMYVFPGITAAPAPKYEIETPNDYQRPRIRQTMYGLKKELQHAISILKDCQRWLPDAAKVIVGDVTNGMGILFDVVGGIMASNGPAWIEGLTSETERPRLINYSEFGNLDPIVIEDYSARIQQICGLVHIDAAESRTWSEEMIREHHVCMLIEQQQIDSLEHIVSVLKGMLLR